MLLLHRRLIAHLLLWRRLLTLLMVSTIDTWSVWWCIHLHLRSCHVVVEMHLSLRCLLIKETLLFALEGRRLDGYVA